MSVYAVYDTNVIVSALLSRNANAATVKVLDACLVKQQIIPVYNADIIKEYREVFLRPKFHFPEPLVMAVIKKLIAIGVHSDAIHSDEHFVDPKDIVFYEVAISKDGAYLITGNRKHFPNTPIVVTPAEMVSLLQQMDVLGS